MASRIQVPREGARPGEGRQNVRLGDLELRIANGELFVAEEVEDESCIFTPLEQRAGAHGGVGAGWRLVCPAAFGHALLSLHYHGSLDVGRKGGGR